jgi:hypothetical protein
VSLPAATTTTIGLTPRATAAGAVGLAGVPLTRYRSGFIAGAALQLGLAGFGYLPLSLNATLGPQPAYPTAFTPVALGIIPLHRLPTTLSGRVASRIAGPLAAAAVTLDGIWPTFSALGNPVPSAPNLVALDSPLYAARDTAATVAQQNLTAAPPAEAKTLLAPANVGDATVRLSDWASLVAGSILAFDIGDPGRAEYIAISAITPLGLGPNFPASIALSFPLARPHAAGASAIRMIPGATGAANALSRPGQAGDVSLFPYAMAGLDASMTAVVVGGGGAGVEFHTARLVAATSNAAGYMRLPPVHRVAQLRLRTHHPSQAADLLTDVMLPFGAEAITQDLMFP